MNLPLIQAILTGTLASGGIATGFLVLYDPDTLRWYGNAEIFVKAEDGTANLSAYTGAESDEDKKLQWCRLTGHQFSHEVFECSVYSSTSSTSPYNSSTFKTKVTEESTFVKDKYYKIHSHRHLWNSWIKDPTQKIVMSAKKKSSTFSKTLKPLFSLTDSEKILVPDSNNSPNENIFLVGKAAQLETNVPKKSPPPKSDPKPSPKTTELTKGNKKYVCSGSDWGGFNSCNIYDFAASAGAATTNFDKSTTADAASIKVNNYYKFKDERLAYDPLFIKIEEEKIDTNIIKIIDVKKSLFIDSTLFIFDKDKQ